MKIKESIHQKVAVMEIKGNLMGPPETNKLVDDVSALMNDGLKRIVMDFSGVDWMNSLGVGALMKCYKALKERKGNLYLVGLTEKVKSVFMISQLLSVFTVKDSVQEAVDELNNS